MVSYIEYYNRAIPPTFADIQPVEHTIQKAREENGGFVALLSY